MKRHPILRGLSSEHHHGLVMARRLRLAHEDGGPETLRLIAEAFLQFQEDDLKGHFREEEEVLLPFLAGYTSPEDAMIARTLVEHVRIRQAAMSLRAHLESEDDLSEIAGETGHLLERHIRFEERELFPHIEQAVTEPGLAEMARLLEPDRRACRLRPASS
ncbi:MAG: hemerythrin domain-containing protein [Armatimonadetes bacterium]|nr:hemerythrin domain-containing protein [Armatimonadota bacterium]